MSNLHIPNADSYTCFGYVSHVARLSCHFLGGHKCVAWDCVQDLCRQVGVALEPLHLYLL